MVASALLATLTDGLDRPASATVASAAPNNRDTRLPALAGFAFLLGIAWHSFLPYRQVPIEWLAIGFALGVCFMWLGKDKPRWFALGLVTTASLVGVWRFDSVRPALPTGCGRGDAR